MDLAEIRKKARQQAEADGPREPLLPAASPPEPDETPETEDLEFSLPRSPAVAGDGLQQFFPDIELASEEDYIQGLSGKEKSAERQTVRWLTFYLGGEEYALALDVILELIKPRPYTDLPKAPDYVRGILSLRGEVVPVVDLRRRLRLSAAEEGSTAQRIVVCEGPQQPIGLLVDRITQVIRMPTELIEPAPLMLVEGEREFVAGVGRYQGRMLILLNPAEVLNL